MICSNTEGDIQRTLTELGADRLEKILWGHAKAVLMIRSAICRRFDFDETEPELTDEDIGQSAESARKAAMCDLVLYDSEFEELLNGIPGSDSIIDHDVVSGNACSELEELIDESSTKGTLAELLLNDQRLSRCLQEDPESSGAG